jgi:hypothetical protein
MNWSVLAGLVNSSKLGGWVRAGAAAGLVWAVSHYSPLGDILTPSVQTDIAGLAGTIAVGIWSHYVKPADAKTTAPLKAS